MLSRRNTISSPNPATATIRKGSRVRRSKTISHPTPTRSELLAPEERSQQAVAAAQRAYGDDMQRRRSQIVRFSTPVDIRYTGAVAEAGDNGYRTATAAAGETSKVTDTTAANTVANTHNHVPVSYDTMSTESYPSEATKERRWSMQESMQQRFTPRGRRSMNFTTSDAEDSFETSSPSSYRRLRKTKSVFSVGQQPNNEYPSSVVYSSELSPEGVGDKNRRRSTSFLRGGTDFMPGSMRRQYDEDGGKKPIMKERKSFYLSASARRGQKPIAFPETVRGKKKEEEDPNALSIRKAVGAKARKMSASFFGTMRRAFGKQVKLEPAFPEQHVTSTRQHFRDYVSPNELHENILDIPEPNNFAIRPAVVSRAPTFRHVPSYEMLHSVTGSIRETSPMPPVHRSTSIATDGMSTWNATLEKRASLKKKRLSIIDENMPGRVKENFYSPPPVEHQQTQKSYEAKRVYSALMRRLDMGSPSAKREEAEYVHGPGYHGPGYYMAPGLALRPEDEDMFERPYTAASANTVVTAIRKNSGKWRGNSKDGNEQSYVPPVPPLPTFYQQELARDTTTGTNEWLAGSLAAEAGPQMSTDSKLAGLLSSLNTKSDGNKTPPLSSAPTTPASTPGRRLRVARSASTFFPYSSSVDEVVRESTPSPYRKATSVMDNASTSSVYIRNTTTTNTPSEATPPPPPPPQRTSEYTYRSNTNAPAPKMKIKGGLKVNDYNPSWSRSSVLTSNENYTNTPRNTPRNTPSSINMNENYSTSRLKNKENENTSQNRRKNKTKTMLRSGSQGIGLPQVIYRSRSVLSQMSTVDIENAVNTQFGPVVSEGGGMGWKGASTEKVGRMERKDSPMVFL